MEGFNLISIILISLAGGLGALVHGFVLGEGMAFPAITRKDGRILIASGFFAYLLLGMVIALGINLFLNLEEPLKQIGLALAAGFGGGAFYASLLNRLTIWKERAEREIEREKAKRIIRKYEEKYLEVVNTYTDAQSKLEQMDLMVEVLAADKH